MSTTTATLTSLTIFVQNSDQSNIGTGNTEPMIDIDFNGADVQFAFDQGNQSNGCDTGVSTENATQVIFTSDQWTSELGEVTFDVDATTGSLTSDGIPTLELELRNNADSDECWGIYSLFVFVTYSYSGGTISTLLTGYSGSGDNYIFIAGESDLDVYPTMEGSLPVVDWDSFNGEITTFILMTQTQDVKHAGVQWDEMNKISMYADLDTANESNANIPNFTFNLKEANIANGCTRGLSKGEATQSVWTADDNDFDPTCFSNNGDPTSSTTSKNTLNYINLQNGSDDMWIPQSVWLVGVGNADNSGVVSDSPTNLIPLQCVLTWNMDALSNESEDNYATDSKVQIWPTLENVE